MKYIISLMQAYAPPVPGRMDFLNPYQRAKHPRN